LQRNCSHESHPDRHQPIEIYSAERVREFDAAEAELEKLLRGKKKSGR
jgi:hypothetical protein